MKPLFWNLITKSRTQVLQSLCDVCQTTDKDVPLTPIFFVCALASNKFICLASKQKFSWLRPTANDFSIRMNLCVAACYSFSWRYLYRGRKLVEEVSGTPEGTREDWSTGVQRNIHQKEIWPQYKLQNQIWFTLDMFVQIIKYFDWSKSDIHVD